MQSVLGPLCGREWRTGTYRITGSRHRDHGCRAARTSRLLRHRLRHRAAVPTPVVARIRLLIGRRIPVISDAHFARRSSRRGCHQHAPPRRTTCRAGRGADRGILRRRWSGYHVRQLPARRASHAAGKMGLASVAPGSERGHGQAGSLFVLLRLSLSRKKPLLDSRSSFSLSTHKHRSSLRTSWRSFFALQGSGNPGRSAR